MKKLIRTIVAAAAILTGSAFAGGITAEQARAVAGNFVTKDSIGQSVLSGRTVDTVMKRGGFYLVTLKPAGYLLVSANRSARPIPVFSGSDFVEPAVGSPQAAFLAAAETNALNATDTRYETQWKTLLGERTLRLTTFSTTPYVNVEPMVTTSWDQNYPYNDLMPIINRSATLVGCVATAYSQILRYWQWPEVLDEDIVTEHSVDSMWGHKWRLKAGTIFDWADMPASGGYDYATRLKLGRGAMFAGMLARMTYNTAASGTQTARPGQNHWYTPYTCLDTSNSTLEQREEGMKQSLENGCPFMVSVNYGTIGHAVVGDGWQESASGKYVHLNYGWGFNNSYYATTEPLGVYLNSRPRPMVMNRPLSVSSALPVKVEWSFPVKGYETTLNDFRVSYTEVEEAVADWTDDMSAGQGTIEGACISVETVDATGHGNVMRIGTKADDATYTWPTMVATKDTVFSYDIHSWNALGMVVEIQLLDPSVGWISLATPEIGERSEIEWTNHSIDLGQYAGKGIAIRVKAARTGSSSYNDDTSRATGVQFDNVRLTSVRQPKKTVAGISTAAKGMRSLSINDAALVSGKTYLFQVTPTFSDANIEGVPSYLASCTIVDASAAKPTITSVASVRSGAPAIQNNLYRECYFGLNQFGVYGSEATTKLEAYLSNLVVIGEVQEEDACSPGTMITTHNKVSIEDAVTYERKSPGNFLVKVNASKLTDYLNGAGMILTLVARNDQGDVAQKDVFLKFTKTGSEQELAIADLPENGGTVTPDEPAPVYHTVTFNANGGTGGEQRQILSGNTISAFPTVSYAGHALRGWFDQAEGGTRIYESQMITGNATYYAQWEESTGGGGDEPGDEPGGGDPVDDGNTRFCHGVSTTAGAYDVTRSGTWNTITPIGYNLIFWWVDRYEEANGAKPSDYIAPSTSSIPDNGSWTVQSYTANLLDSALKTTLAAGEKRNPYFPTATCAVNEWNDGATSAAAVKAAGRHIYAALANGPIGVKVITSLSRSYGAVIWGCDYATDGTDKYATKVYITESTSSTRNDKVVVRELKWTETNDGNFTNVGIKDFNGSGNPGVIDYYYPITGPAGSGGGDDEPTTKTFIVTFDSNGGAPVSAQSIEGGKTLASIPTPTKGGFTFDGWFDGDTQLTSATKITANVTYTARWTEIVIPPVDPDEPDKPDTPEEPDDDGKIGAASNDGDPGNFYTHYNYTMNDNYWTARKLAIQQRKQLLVLSGAAWCSNCSFVKDYLNSKAAQVSANFIVYFSDHDSYVCNYFNGGLPQYGAADPRTVDAFTGTLNGNERSWALAWQKSTSGIYVQDRGGYAPERVQTVIDTGAGKAKIGSPTNLVIRGLSTLATGYAGKYELYAQFDDGVEMPVDHGVTWSVVSGNGSIVEAGIEGRDIGKLTINSGSVVIRAESTFYFTGYRTMTVAGADIGSVKSVAILTDSVNLEDDATPMLEAIATMNDGSTIPVAGFGNWSAVFKSRIERNDPELEEENQSPSISFDENSRLVYEPTNGRLEVCDQKIDVTLELNGKSVTKEIVVWGPTKVVPSKWKMISGLRQTALGVVRLQCTELKYNYGGKIHTTADTYFASYKTVLKYDSSYYPEVSYLRGLTAASISVKGENCKVGLTATKANGKYTGYSPAEPFASNLATNFTNVAKGATVTDLAHGEVPMGFFNAFWPAECANKTTDQLREFALEDSDDDGFANWEEYVLGTDPTDKGDAFTLMQGYQHLTAPAANGATMQYKVMYQQRARRIYYIEAKKTWSEDWTPVATVSLANMTEADVTTFTSLNAAYADMAKFFRVRASLYENVFNDPDKAPKITPNMLVAAPDSIIDLTNETLPLKFSSFDTDATDAGTVWVKVAANATPGAILMSAPKAAGKSLKACRPYERTDLAFEVVEVGDTLALRVAGDVPAVADGKGSVTVGDSKIIVAPNEGVTEIALVNVGEKQVEIPSSLVKVGGVTDSKKLIVRSGAYDVTEAMRFSPVDGGFGIELDETAVVTVGAEKIPVRPTWTNDDNEVPFEFSGGNIVFKVKSIPGLKYQVLASDSLDSNSFTPAGKECEATGTRRELTVTRSGETKGFFKVRVSR